jgi:hypothetical protein
VVGYFENSSRVKPTIGGFGTEPVPGKVPAAMGEHHIDTQIQRARMAESGLIWAAAVAIPILLAAPAIWNGYPLLQFDTGGYLARWYEGYLVPSRSTVFGLYLHFGQNSSFWINLGIQALATFWILQLTLRVLGMGEPLRLLGIGIVLVLTTTLPFLASMLLTDIFAGLSVLALYVMVLHGGRISGIEKCALFAFVAFSAASHSATLAVLLGLCCIGFVAWLFMRGRVPGPGLLQGWLSLLAGAGLLLSANFALSGELAWTPGGYGVAFGRMLQDGIVAQYLRDHCGQEKLKLCPWRNQLPDTADQFLWGNSMFNTLGRFKGMNDEMTHIVQRSLAEYPAWQAEAALAGTAKQLTMAATGEGTNAWLGHTYGIFERYIPSQVRPMRAANQQRWHLDFTAVNYLHEPVALTSALLLAAIFVWRWWWRGFDDLTWLAATVSFAVLGNAFVCAVISGPHDRYGARLAWLPTLVVLMAAIRSFSGDDERHSYGRADRNSATPAL